MSKREVDGVCMTSKVKCATVVKLQCCLKQEKKILISVWVTVVT